MVYALRFTITTNVLTINEQITCAYEHKETIQNTNNISNITEIHVKTIPEK